MASGDDGDYGQGQGIFYNKYIGPHVQEEIWASIVRVLARAQVNASQARAEAAPHPGGAIAGSNPMPGHSIAIMKALQGVATLHAVGYADKAGAAELTKAASELFAGAGRALASR